MTLLSRKADYALLILLHLHQHESGACAREITERFGLGQAFVANILKELCRKGFVASRRGVKGGYRLARPASAVNLADLLDALEDGVRLAECNGDGVSTCTLAAGCPVKGPVAQVHERLRAVLRAVSLEELFRPNTTAGVLLHLAVPALTPISVETPDATPLAAAE